MKKPVTLLSCIVILGLLSFLKGEANDPKDHLNLSFTKTVSIKKYKNLNVHCEPYTIQEGDWLWKILEDKYNIPADQRQHFLHILKSINPEIFNADSVYPGQKIFVPIKLEVPSSASSSFYIKEHVVQSGQCVSGILYRTYKVPKHKLFSDFMKHFRNLNPTIEDPNLIRINQRILVPVPKPGTKKEHEITPKKSTEQIVTKKVDKPEVSPVPVPMPKPGTKKEREITPKKSTEQIVTKKVDKPEVSPSPGGVREEVDSTEKERPVTPLSTQRAPKAFEDSIGAFFSDIGDSYNNKGSYHIPIPGGGELTLDTTAFPMLEMENGRRVVMDLDDALPAKIEKMIESNWENYRFVNIQRNESVGSVFSKIFSLAGYESVARGDKPTRLGGDITVEVWSDWIIIKDKDSARQGRSLAVNLVGEGGEGVPPPIKNYLEERGMRVVDFSLGGRKEEEKGLVKAMVRGEEETMALNSSTNRGLVQALLALTDQPFTINAKQSLSKTSSTGFKMGITADISLKRADKDFIISLQDLPDDLVEMLNENGYSVLEIREAENRESIISRVLGFLDIKFSSSKFEFHTARKGDPHDIAISIPGFLFNENPSRKVLLTKVNLDKNLNLFLRERGVKAVRY